MELLGEFLKETRIKKNISLDQIAEDTNITKRYLEALENEEFSIFPGETYLKGFLRTYCNYLKLDANDIIKRYEKIKMAETPTPIEQLIPKPKLNFKPLITISFLLLFISGITFGTIMVIKNISKNKKNDIFAKNENKKDKKNNNEEIITYKMSQKEHEKIFILKKNDIIEIATEYGKYNIKIKQLSPTVVISDSNEEKNYLIKGHHYKVDIDNDQNDDIEMTLNFWDNEIANITMKIIDKQEKLAANLKAIKGVNPEALAIKNEIEKIKFSINIQSPTFLRYKIDEQKEVEGFYKNKTNITADKRVIIWMANSGVVKYYFPNYEKTFLPGKLGEVAVKLIEWHKLPSDEYELRISSLN